jgi:hypothetical protein
MPACNVDRYLLLSFTGICYPKFGPTTVAPALLGSRCERGRGSLGLRCGDESHRLQLLRTHDTARMGLQNLNRRKIGAVFGFEVFGAGEARRMRG